MTLAFVVHLVPESITQGRMAGRVEVVRTGETQPWRSGDELLAILEAHTRQVTGATSERSPGSGTGPSLGAPGARAQRS